jgi:hypothetical protein
MTRHTELDEGLMIGMIADPLTWDRWQEARAYLHPALMESDQDWPEAEADLAKNDTQLWAVMSKGGGQLLAAAVTRIVRARAGEVVEVFLVGGRGFREWIGPLNDVIEMSARQIGCVGMRAYGREGWLPTLKANGWRMSFVGYEKAL